MLSACTDTTVGSGEAAVDTGRDTEDEASTQAVLAARQQEATTSQSAPVGSQQPEKIAALQPPWVFTPQPARIRAPQVVIDVVGLQCRWQWGSGRCE